MYFLRFIISRMGPERLVHQSHLTFCKAWVVYAAATFTLGHVITFVLTYTVFGLILGNLAEATWTGWLEKSVQPIVFTLVSLLVFRWAVIRMLLTDFIFPLKSD